MRCGRVSLRRRLCVLALALHVAFKQFDFVENSAMHGDCFAGVAGKIAVPVQRLFGQAAGCFDRVNCVHFVSPTRPEGRCVVGGLAWRDVEHVAASSLKHRPVFVSVFDSALVLDLIKCSGEGSELRAFHPDFVAHFVPLGLFALPMGELYPHCG